MRKEAVLSFSLFLSLPLTPHSFDENVNLAGNPLEKLSQLIPKRLIPFDYHPIAGLPILYADESHCLPSRPGSIRLQFPLPFIQWLREKSPL